MLRKSALYLVVQSCNVDVFILVIPVNSCKHYAGSFSHSPTFWACIISSTLDNHGSWQGTPGEQKPQIFVHVFCPHRLNKGLSLNVGVVQCVKLFHCFTSHKTAKK